MVVTIEKLIYGGEGLAHHNGHTVFVPFVLPGEVAEVETIEEKRKFIRGRARSLITSSAERVVAPCRHFTECGGCHYQHIPYEAQLRYKIQILRETMARIGRIVWDGAITAHPSPPLGYRNRAQWKIRPIARGNSQLQNSGAIILGYFRAGSSTLCAIKECPILSPRLEETMAALSAALAKRKFPAALREIEAFADASDRKVLLNGSFAGFPMAADRLRAMFREAVPWHESLLLTDTSSERMELFGPGFLRYEVNGATYRVGHMSFFQVNRFLLNEMAATVANQAGPGGRLALDLYSGVGLFTLSLAKNYERVIAVEANPASARDLEENIRANQSCAEPQNRSAEDFLNKWKEPPDLVVLDPPRAGVEPAALARLAELSPGRIIYVSCEPSTLARDLAALIRERYKLEEVHLFDLFPETFHMESLVRLTRT
jgi:23S rRNA (uracil1939-C5)-methyltransferase